MLNEWYMFTLIRRRIILSLSALLMVLSISVFPLSSEASAKTIQEMNISEASAAMGYYYALRVCVRDAIAISDFSQESLDKYGFFGDKAVILGGQFITSDGDWDGVENCSSTKDKTAGEDGGWVRNAIATLGYSSPRDFLCHVMSGAGTVNYESCRGGQGNLSTFEFATKTKAEREAAFSATVGKKVFSNTEPLNRVEGDAIMQNILYNSFYAFCQPTDHNGGSVGSNLKQMAVKKYEAGPPATYTDKQVVVKTDRLSKTVGIIEASPEGMHRTLSCDELPGNISIFADRAKSDLKDLRTNFFENANTGAATHGGVDGGSKSSCAVDGIGWIVCPALGFMSTISDELFSFLATQFLSVDTRTVSTSSGTYVAWSAMRNIANVAFVIAFLVIIFSQLTSVGITAYGIKKMLPRLIVAAILVNMSFIICQIAVDLSNILGYGLKSLFESVESRIALPNTVDATGNGFGIALITTALLAGGITLAFAMSIPVIGAVLLTLLVIIFILLARKALIVLLVVIAPLAFVAYLLPNTEQWFKKWQKMFFALLLVFPVIAVVFGASSLAAFIIKSTAAPGDNLTPLIAIGVAAIPLIMVPSLLKGSIAAAGAIGTVMKGWGDKSQNRVGGKIGSTSRLGQFQNYRKVEADRRRGLIQAGAYEGSNKNPLNWGRNAASAANRRFNASGISGGFGDRSAAAGREAAKKIDYEKIDALKNQFNTESVAMGDQSDAYLQEQFEQAIVRGDDIATRAAYSALMEQGQGGVARIQQSLAKQSTIDGFSRNTAGKRSLQQHIQEKHSDVKASDSRVMQWASNGSMDTDGSHISNLTDGQIATQTTDSLDVAIANNRLVREDALRILGNPNAVNNMKLKQREKLEVLAGVRPAPSAGGSTGPSSTPPPVPPVPPPVP